MVHRLALIAALILVPVSLATAQSGGRPDDPILVIELWTELDPLVADGGERPVPRELAIERLLDEATTVFSGMIYGFRFRYVPSDPAREVSEVFELEPYAMIVRGDPRLEVHQTWVEADRLYARISYAVDASQLGWYRGWQSAANVSSTGRGTVAFVRGPAEKPRALRDAIRMAVRNYARGVEFNRPQEIAGAVLLEDAPRVGIREGNYEATVEVILQIDSIERYRIY